MIKNVQILKKYKRVKNEIKLEKKRDRKKNFSLN